MRELRQRLWLKISTWITLTACFCVLTGAVLFASNLSRVLTLWGDDIQITAYLAPETTDEQAQVVQTAIQQNRQAGRIEFINRERALKEFREQLASYAPDLAGDRELLSVIPASFQVSLAAVLSPEQHFQAIQTLAQQIHQIPGIEEVRFGQEWVKKYAALISTTQRTFLFVGIVLVLAAFFVIGNTVRAAIEARRHEIEVLELVGATTWMIRKPFLVEGVTIGALAAATSLGLMGLLFTNVKDLIAHEMDSAVLAAQLSFLSPVIAICFVLGAGLLGLAASYLCLRRINSGFAAAGRTP